METEIIKDPWCRKKHFTERNTLFTKVTFEECQCGNVLKVLKVCVDNGHEKMHW